MGRNIVQLGRLGDILNILPALEPGDRLFIDERFWRPLGCLECLVPVKFRPQGLMSAVGYIQSRYGDVWISQVDRNPAAQLAQNAGVLGFAALSWYLIGRKWNSGMGLFGRFAVGHDPKGPVIWNARGVSSPFPQLAKIMSDTDDSFAVPASSSPIWETLKTTYAKARLLVTIDTATYHLCRWSTIPVVLLTKGGFLASSRLDTEIARFMYGEADLTTKIHRLLRQEP